MLSSSLLFLLYTSAVSAQSTELDAVKYDLSQAQCGGWIPFDVDFPEITNFIPTATGVPGRDGIPLGNVESGMAERIETKGVNGTGFLFPNDTTGFSTACRPGTPPVMEEHPCQRPGPGVRGVGSRVAGVSDASTNGVKWSCDALCTELNQWVLTVWENGCSTECYNSSNGPPPTPECAKGDSVVLQCCTLSPTAPNCQQCAGEDCRNTVQILNGFESLNDPYKSYYRQYEGTCQRSPIPPPYVNEDDYERREVPVACYGFYKEYDPKDQAPLDEDFSCVIANTFPGANHDFLDMKTTQRINTAGVDYGQRSNWADPPSPDFDPDRAANFNKERDIWSPLNGGFSLINTDLLQKNYANNLTFAILDADTTAFRVYPQLTTTQPISTGGLLRAFDETVTNERRDRRTLVEWWQEVQTQMNEFLTPPSFRIILPAPWVAGLDKEDPFVLEDPSALQEVPDRPDSVQVLLQANEDTLGELAAYFERSQLLRIKEEEISLVVPLASPAEIRALADSWCTWYQEKSEDTSCIHLPEDVREMIDGLEDYAVYIDNIRRLRSELYFYESAVLERQQVLLSVLSDWLKDTTTLYSQYTDSLDQLDSYRQEWKDLQNLYRDFHDKSNFPWCMNTRFTVPIYSMLAESWFPGRPDLTGGIDASRVVVSTDFTVLPRLDIYMPKIDLRAVNQHDVVVDVSTLYTYADSLRIPVLKPTQIRLDWNSLTPPGKDDPVPAPPPPLPPVPSIHEYVNSHLPTLEYTPPPPSIVTYVPEAVRAIDEGFFAQVTQILTGMNSQYDKFWKSLLLEDVIPGTEEDCLVPNSERCVHTEMDLRERFQRMCARPGILLKEDFLAIGSEWKNPAQNDYEKCDRSDWACQVLFRTTEQGRKGWSIQYPSEEVQDTFIGRIRKQMFQDTLLQKDVPEASQLRYIVTPAEMMPTFNVPHSKSLIPEFPILTPSEN